MLKLCGKPLIQYSIDLARSCDFICEVFLSTDCQLSAELGKRLGAVVIDRPSNLATDSSPEWLSWKHAQKWVEERYGDFDNFVSLPATSPLRTRDDVKKSLQRLSQTNADLCVGITETNHHPAFNMVKRDKNCMVKILDGSARKFNRRQDAPKIYNLTTTVFTATSKHLNEHNGVFDGNVTSITIPKERAIDIDDIFDFKIAGFVMRKMDAGKTD